SGACGLSTAFGGLRPAGPTAAAFAAPSTAAFSTTGRAGALPASRATDCACSITLLARALTFAAADERSVFVPSSSTASSKRPDASVAPATAPIHTPSAWLATPKPMADSAAAPASGCAIRLTALAISCGTDLSSGLLMASSLRRRQHGRDVVGVAGELVDTPLDLRAEIADQPLDRPRRRVAQRADGVALDLLGDVEQHIDLALLRL